jgi:hypothetical protein
MNAHKQVSILRLLLEMVVIVMLSGFGCRWAAATDSNSPVPA